MLVLATLVPARADELDRGWHDPPAAAKPWVYWFVMDGNFRREGITADLEAMKRVGLGGVLFMEVDLGIPRGPVPFMSPAWRELFQHANKEAARLGLTITMPASPGWTGSGGPWVKPEQSMQKLVWTELAVEGPKRLEGTLSQPSEVAGYYRDVAVLAFPTPVGSYRIPDIAEKTLAHRGHFTSERGVASMIPAPSNRPTLPTDQVIALDKVVDLTDRLKPGGRISWDVPAGRWTIVRFGHTSTGATTHPAPLPGLGLECDKLDKTALDAHFHDFLGKLLADIHPLAGKSLVSLHIDSWEMGPQNWTGRFPDEFRNRRGYDLRRYLPVMTGQVVTSEELSERFLWDLRQTVLELIVENHAGHLAELAHAHGLGLSIEPYDGTPCDDMTYGSRADVPMGEFWTDTFESWFACTEATSIAHIQGKRIIQAEAFTSGDGERWKAHPGSLKALGDWAFCEGINRLVFHRYAHQPWDDRRPAMTMGPYGIHYERTTTWWDRSDAWIAYLTRCQFLLQRGLPVADILFLEPEASPQVFQAPASATKGNPPSRLGYNFDGCTPEALLTRASVSDGRIMLPDGMSYRMLVLPRTPTMTPRLLSKVKELAEAGATVVGSRPLRSPSLSNYPYCDREVLRLADALWGNTPDHEGMVQRSIGSGRLITGHALASMSLYPDYDALAAIFKSAAVPPDFEAEHDLRFTHRRDGEAEIYFVANGQPTAVRSECTFRVAGKAPELWDAVTGESRHATTYRQHEGRTTLPLELAPNGSVFVIFRGGGGESPAMTPNAPQFSTIATLSGPWKIQFDPKAGGPASSVEFAELEDWTRRPEAGIKYYSGTALYAKTFRAPISPSGPNQRLVLDLGRVAVLARIKLNSQVLGTVWTPPYRVDVTGKIQPGENTLEVEAVNLWPNRMIGDKTRSQAERVTWSTWDPFKADSPLLESGLLGPVTLQIAENSAGQ